MRRVLVVDTSGAGKTTLAGRISARLGIEHVEIDALFHGPAWTPRPEFLDDVRTHPAREAWVTEWQYAAARPLLLERATLVVWLDLPLWLWLSRVVRRTVQRRWRRTELWNGNVEASLWRSFTEGIIRWAWRTRRKYDDLPAQLLTAGRGGLPLVRLRSRAEVEAWLATLPVPARE
ncbi:ATPase AAA [Nocardioides sp. Iso805N]|uniref:ATPase AAA n=1 Tax=Nocardioides sp. Iso805N TaxID=1283287 RepID=UPI0004757FFA|nr:ATPase AAA [Nocardioides sp. Iso805N]